MKIAPSAPALGAEVTGVTVREILDDRAIQRDLYDAFLERMVLGFRDLDPTADELVALGRVFGTVENMNPGLPTVEGNPDITMFDSAEGYKADKWHTDATFRPDTPAAALLAMRIRPPVGGDTMFANCALAYEHLSGGMKALLADRRAHHEALPGTDTQHPVVREHPETGAPVLFVNAIFTRVITNLPGPESEAVLPFLVAHVGRPEFTYRHVWQDGDVVLWDQRPTQHYALFDFGPERRCVHRITLRDTHGRDHFA